METVYLDNRAVTDYSFLLYFFKKPKDAFIQLPCVIPVSKRHLPLGFSFDALMYINTFCL